MKAKPRRGLVFNFTKTEKVYTMTHDTAPTREQLEKQLMLQHPVRGRMEQEYEIYVAAAEDLGWDVKTFDEWLDS